MILRARYAPPPHGSRMGNHGDLAAARARYVAGPSRNLEFLLTKRYGWLNDHIAPTDVGVELAAGIGVARDHVVAASLVLTDVDEGEWLDVPGVDATATPFPDGGLDFVIMQNGIHHLAQPIRVFEEAARLLKPGGRFLVQDVTCSLLQRVLARLTRVEGYDYDIDVFDRDALISDPAKPWEANNAVPDLLFDDVAEFERRVPDFRVLEQRYSECLVFLDSGGVTHKTLSVPLPSIVLRVLDRLDGLLTRAAPGVFALQRSVVLERREASTQ